MVGEGNVAGIRGGGGEGRALMKAEGLVLLMSLASRLHEEDEEEEGGEEEGTERDWRIRGVREEVGRGYE